MFQISIAARALRPWIALACIIFVVGAVHDAEACTGSAPPQSSCGDPQCASVVCLTTDNTWDCHYSAIGASCGNVGQCDGNGTCVNTTWTCPTSPAPPPNQQVEPENG